MAIAAAQLFLPSGTIASLKGQTVIRAVSARRLRSGLEGAGDGVDLEWVRRARAEILAAALSDNQARRNGGRPDVWNCVVQKLIQLDDGSALILTVANYYTPDNKEIPANGVAATSEVRPSIDEVIAANDGSLPVRRKSRFLWMIR